MLIFLAQVKQRENLLVTVRQQDHWVHEDPVIRAARRVFPDPLRIQVCAMQMRISQFTKRAHQVHRNRLMGKLFW